MTILLNDVIQKSLYSLNQIGLKPETIKDCYLSSFDFIKNFYHTNDLEEFNSLINDKIMKLIKNEFDEEKISRKIYNQRIRALSILTETYLMGVYEWKVTLIPKSWIVTKFDETLNNHLNSRVLSDRCLDFERKVLFEFSYYLVEKGVDSPKDILPKYIIDFLRLKQISCKGSLDKIGTAISKYLTYLFEAGILSNDYRNITKVSIRKDLKVKKTFDQKDICILLNSIDRMSILGKRDYAIISLAYSTGLRAGDIIKLELCDIDWKNKKLSLVQGKTKFRLELPLSKEMLDILADYILNGRPETSSNKLFIRFLAPYKGFKEGTALNNMIRRRLEKIGVLRKKGDGKTIHGIRRMIGTELIKNKFSVDVVAQVLGHQSIRPTKQYISLDLEGLKKCALSMSSLGNVK